MGGWGGWANAGAGEDALTRAWEECRDPVWILWYAGQMGLPDLPGAAERLDACAALWPWLALVYCPALLTPARLDACAEASPEAARRYAASLLTPVRRQIARRSRGKGARR